MLFGKHINKYYLKYGILMIIGVAALIVVNMLQIEIPRLFGDLIEGFEGMSGTSELLRKFTRDFLIIVGLMAIGRVLWRFLLMGTSRRIQHDMRKELFEHAMSLDQPYFQTNKVGAIMSYFSNDIEAVRRSFGQGLLFILDGLFLGIIVVIRMFNINARLTLFSTIPMIFMGIISYFIIRKMRIVFKERQDSFEHLNEFTQESFSGIQVVKAFVKESKEALTFKKTSNEFYNKHMEYVKTSIWVRIIINVFITLTSGTIIAVAIVIAIKNPADMTTSNFIEFFSLFGTLVWPVMALTHFASLRSQAGASYTRLENLYNATPLLTDGTESIDVQGNIRFENLSFAYPDAPEEMVLKDISVEIKKGESVGILGRTGSGKTTFVDLLLRVYNVDEGTLFIDDQDVMNLKVKDVREGIAYVPQDNFLYSTTIRDNIAFSATQLTDDEVIEAAKLADIYDNVIDFKDGFETVLGERGTTVSGGQKQRISIARALAKEANVLIFDDSVSAVDTNTEETILNNLKEIREGKTTIIIAHRISTVRNLDKIVLLDFGEVVDVGTHDELMERSELYQEMVHRQTLESVVSGDA